MIAAVPERVDPADLLLVRARRDRAKATTGCRSRAARASARHRRARRVWLAALPAGPRDRAAAWQCTDARAQARGRRVRRDRARGGRRRTAPGRRAAPRRSMASRCGGSTPRASCPRPRKARSPCNAGATTTLCSRRCSVIDHSPSHAAVTAERDALARAEGGCDVAFGAYCVARAECTAARTSCSRCMSARAVSVWRACRAATSARSARLYGPSSTAGAGA